MPDSEQDQRPRRRLGSSVARWPGRVIRPPIRSTTSDEGLGSEGRRPASMHWRDPSSAASARRGPGDTPGLVGCVWRGSRPWPSTWSRCSSARPGRTDGGTGVSGGRLGSVQHLRCYPGPAGWGQPRLARSPRRVASNLHAGQFPVRHSLRVWCRDVEQPPRHSLQYRFHLLLPVRSGHRAACPPQDLAGMGGRVGDRGGGQRAGDCGRVRQLHLAWHG